MTTAPPAPRTERPAHMLFSRAISGDHTIDQNADGTISVKHFKVFRTGTFKDSWGEQNTWDELLLNQMVTNFNHLLSSGLLPNVPFRDGHPGLFSSGGRVVGYHTNLYLEDGTM